MSKLKVGDIVELKSGGPRMTVAFCSENGGYGRNSYLCSWFDVIGHVNERNFNEDTLRKVEDEENNALRID